MKARFNWRLIPENSCKKYLNKGGKIPPLFLTLLFCYWCHIQIYIFIQIIHISCYRIDNQPTYQSSKPEVPDRIPLTNVPINFGCDRIISFFCRLYRIFCRRKISIFSVSSAVKKRGRCFQCPLSKFYSAFSIRRSRLSRSLSL